MENLVLNKGVITSNKCDIYDLTEDVDIALLINNAQFGISSFDIGYLDPINSQWSAMARFCTSVGDGLHKSISRAFLDFYNKEPINYLFEHYKSIGIDTDVIVHTFTASEKFCKPNELSNNPILPIIKCDQETSQLSLDLHEEFRTFVNLNQIVLPNNFDLLEPFERFCIMQQIFTDYVASVYNRKHGYIAVKYISIVLFAYRSYDGLYHFTHNAAIFSNKKDYIQSDIARLIFQFITKSKYLDEVGSLKLKADNQAIKSAKAAIMSRNMSHNLGSHVMAYLKQRLNSVEDIIKENSLASIIKNNSIAGNSSDDYEILNVLLKSINSGEAIDTQQEVELPFLVGLGKFINYIQERQDFIATIATSYIPYTSPVNFKDAIYDELNPDLRHLRHKERSGHKPDNILLAYIAKSEGLERTNFDGVEDKFFEDNNDIIIRFRDFKGLIPSTEENSINSISSLEQMKTYDFALPGGTIGRQALFSIIENIIRNAAKHGSRKQNQNLELSIDILDLAKDGESIVEMSKYDTGYPLQVPQGKELNKGVVDDVQQLSLPLNQLLATKYSTAKDIENLYIISITDNLPLINNQKKEESEQSFLELVNAVKAGYIDNETGKMDNTCKGLKEIRISAAWLRGIVDEDVDPLNNAPIVTVRAAKDKTGEYHLQYLICVQKPRKVAVVTADELEIFSDSNERKLKFINAGWRFFTAKEWVNANRSFEIILAEKELCTTDFKTQAPDRLVESTKDQIEKVISASEQLYEGDSSGYEMAYAYLWNLLLKERNRITKEYYQIEKGGRFAIDTNVKNEDIIYIEDGRSFNELKDRETSEDGCYRILSNGKVKVYNDVGTAFRAVSLFRTHHGLDQKCNLINFYDLKFDQYSDKHYVNTVFVEGITGHNSTDRLIRNKFIDDIWYFKQANAIKTKIALFDERVFKKITNLSDDVILDEFAKSNSASILTNEKATLMTQKGIYVLNIIENKHVTHHEFLIFGIDDLSAEYKDGIPETRVKAKLIGRIEAGEGDEVIQIKYEDDCREYFNSHMFDYVTIHQGLLDKLYNKLGASERKNEVTEIMKEHFVKHSENNGFVIHSGRSRPSLKDMPQKVPFIQFAAIDTAIFDSKSTFVELLNFAYYEENNS